MASQALVLLCLSAAFIQNISAQAIGICNDGLPWSASGMAWDNAAPWSGAYYPGPGPYAGEYGPAYSPANLAASNGGGLVVSSSSPIAPTGVAMTSENAYEGLLAVSGALPFLAAVSLEGVLPSLGSGAVMYGCGDGNVAIVSEDAAVNAPNGVYGVNTGRPCGLPGLGYGPLY